MSDLYNQLRLDIDDAKSQNETLVGLKLDKAKAFDRVAPSFVAALFLAFGIPKGITNVFVKLYDGLHRHLTYRKWTCRVPRPHLMGFAKGARCHYLQSTSTTKCGVTFSITSLIFARARVRR